MYTWLVKDKTYKSKGIGEYLAPKEQYELVKKYEKSNNEIASIFWKDNRTKLFNDPLPNPNSEYKEFEGLTLEKVIPIFMKILLNQSKEIEKLKNRIR